MQAEIPLVAHLEGAVIKEAEKPIEAFMADPQMKEADAEG